MIELDISGDNIVSLPVKPRAHNDEEAFLVPVPVTKCIHFQGPFEIDVDGGKCICKRCGDEVTPIFVLEQLMKEESRWRRAHATYQGEMKRLAERSKTKCQHCGKLTRISHS